MAVKLHRCPNIKWIFSHGGGTIPYLAGRVDTMNANDKQAPKYAPQGIMNELKRLYFEIAASANAPNVPLWLFSACASGIAGASATWP